MDTTSLLRIAAWFFYAHLLGYAALPAARKWFPALPDGGLAVSRVLAIALLSLVSLWLAWLHIAPLAGAAPFIFLLVPPAAFAFTLRRRNERDAFFAWIKNHRRALLLSDALFFAAFSFFLWVRLRHPEINDLEKLMDSAIIGTLARTATVPPENPWFAGTPLDSYYYFGHLMTALLSRTLFTPNEQAYNLALALFPALFVSSLATLCSALTRSWRGGVAAALIVTMLGHFEPLRQWKSPVAGSENDLFHLNWWSTSRVIPDTINEYPAFTLTIGDAHAHLFAMPLAALLLCLCHALFSRGASTRARKIHLTLLGITLGALLMTHTWDVPLYALLVLFCAAFTLWKNSARERNLEENGGAMHERTSNASEANPKNDATSARQKGATKTRNAAREETTHNAGITRAENKDAIAANVATGFDALQSGESTKREYSRRDLAHEIPWIFAPLLLSYVVAQPHLASFKSRAGGVKIELWSPPPSGFFLLWGAFLALWFASLWAFSRREYSREAARPQTLSRDAKTSDLPLNVAASKRANSRAAGAKEISRGEKMQNSDDAFPQSRAAKFSRVLAGAIAAASALFFLLALILATRDFTPVFALVAAAVFTMCVFIFQLTPRPEENTLQEITTPKKRAKNVREYSRDVFAVQQETHKVAFPARRENIIFLLLVAFCGLLALAAPMLAYVDDPFFGGTQRRLNTVFRFGLQAWLLLGTAAACSAIFLIRESIARWKKPVRVGAWLGFATLWIVPAACALCVIWARTTAQATRNADGSIPLSLDGARFLPQSDRRALTWLQNNAPPGARVLEAPITQEDGVQIGGDYDARCARIASLSGVAAPLGWPQHAMFWGADWNRDIVPRWNAMQRIYRGDVGKLNDDLKFLGADYIFIGQVERERFGATIPLLEARFPTVFQDGETRILRVPRS